jgi:hypothetical protein
VTRNTLSMAIVALAAACGGEPVPKGSPARDRPTIASPAVARFAATDQTPGYFRDMYRLLAAQAIVDDDTAVARMLIELPNRVALPGELPPVPERTRNTLNGLLILSLRAVEATTETPRPCRQIGERLLGRTLGLDPARAAWNAAHTAGEQVELVQPGAKTLADEARWSITHAAFGAPANCSGSAGLTDGANWDPGEAEQVWIDERCAPDENVGGYCEADLWVEGDCTDVWVPEQCSGGYWVDYGRYDYRCYSEDDCEYVWVEDRRYVNGACAGGYYDERCNSGYWEYGLCYDGTFVPGYCIPGHIEYRFPGGTWTFSPATSTPTECSSVRPSQLAIAATAAFVLQDQAYDDLTPEWQSALDRLVESDKLLVPDETAFDAVLQILDAASNPTPTP